MLPDINGKGIKGGTLPKTGGAPGGGGGAPGGGGGGGAGQLNGRSDGMPPIICC